MKAKKFEQQFDDGVDLTASLDLSKGRRVLQEQKRVNVEFPTRMIDSLDREASKLGSQNELHACRENHCRFAALTCASARGTWPVGCDKRQRITPLAASESRWLIG